MFALFLFLIFVNTSLATCPDGTVSIPSSLGSQWSCLSVITSGNSFLTAELQCQQNGGHLISVSSGFVNLFIARELLYLPEVNKIHV